MNQDILITKDQDKPVEEFAKKDSSIAVSPEIMKETSLVIPYIYYWEDVVDGTSVLMTMAFQMFGQNFGASFPIEDDNAVRIDMLRKKLFKRVKDSLDVLFHHGKKVIDKFGNIDPRLVNDEEAIRFIYDKNWSQKVAAFNKLVRIKPITKKQAKKLKIL